MRNLVLASVLCASLRVDSSVLKLDGYKYERDQWTQPQPYYSKCGGKKIFRSGALSCQEKAAIVDAHNRYRSSVAQGSIPGQPAAANMMEMQWDEGLARQAQSWADQCVIGHDYKRSSDYFPVGQNLAATWTTRSSVSPAPDFQTQINAWFREAPAFDFQHPSYGASTGHYTQLVWADTYLVGCGYTFFYDESLRYSKIYVCNYGPGGNVVGARPYESGRSACAARSMSPSRTYPGLCQRYGRGQSGSLHC